MKKMILATLCVGLSALVVSCTSDSGGGKGSTGGSSAASTSSNQGGSSGTSSSVSSTPSGGSSAPASSSASGGGSSGAGGSNGGSSATPSSGGNTSTGGSTTATSSGGSTSTGGSGTAGASGGVSTSTGGTGTGGRSTGGSGTAGSGGGGATSTGGTLPNNDSVPSKGCGKTDGSKILTTGGSSVTGAPTTSTRLKGVTSGGKSRAVIIDIPADYDPTHPYRLIFSWRQMGGSDTGNATGLHPAGDGPNFDAEHYAYFGLRREALNAKQPAIFVAPDTDPIGGLWDYNKDSAYFDDLLALVTTNLCIDESRVFTTGFSFGAMMSYALSVGRASKLRGAVTMAPANYNFTQPTNTHTAIAYMSTTGMSDGTCPWGDDTRGGKACVLQHAKDNGCTVPAPIPTTTVGSKKYLCYDFEGCKAGYPVKVCTFDGGHTPSSVDDGSSTGDDGLKAFIPPLAWKFIAQF
jgi:hypothetical protein